jgi:hypothetical protein
MRNVATLMYYVLLQLSLTDDTEAVVSQLINYRTVSRLPRTTLAHLQRQHHR